MKVEEKSSEHITLLKSYFCAKRFINFSCIQPFINFGVAYIVLIMSSMIPISPNSLKRKVRNFQKLK